MLAACSGRLVPPSPSSQAPLPERPAPSTHGSAPGYIPRQAPARQPTAAVPIAPMPTTGLALGQTAAAMGVVAGPPVATLPITADEASRALAAFRASCPALLRRTDASGLTQNADWQPACDAASVARDDDATAFFARWFETAQIGDGRAFATGYFVPEIAGSRDRRSGYDVPIYGRPNDLIDVDLGQFSTDLKGKKIRGRVDRTNLVPYFDRAAIDAGAIQRSAPVIAWAADPVEMFFLQIQGSGRLRLPDGGVMVVGYDSQNGRDYVGIGALLKQRGLLGSYPASMQGIMDWLRAHPAQGQAIMDENKSFVFFRELPGAPVGALGVPVAGGTSAAVDPKFVPLGAPRVPVDGSHRRDRAVGRAGYRRRDPRREPLRHLLGLGRRGACDRRRHVGARHCVRDAAGRHARAARGGRWRGGGSALRRRGCGQRSRARFTRTANPHPQSRAPRRVRHSSSHAPSRRRHPARRVPRHLRRPRR